MGVLDKIKGALGGHHEPTRPTTPSAHTSTTGTSGPLETTGAPAAEPTLLTITGNASKVSKAQASTTENPTSSAAGSTNAATTAVEHSKDAATAPVQAASSNGVAFDHNKVTVIYVLGGPGAGTWIFPLRCT
jgi:hypothetical protein